MKRTKKKKKKKKKKWGKKNEQRKMTVKGDKLKINKSTCIATTQKKKEKKNRAKNNINKISIPTNDERPANYEKKLYFFSYCRKQLLLCHFVSFEKNPGVSRTLLESTKLAKETWEIIDTG